MLLGLFLYSLPMSAIAHIFNNPTRHTFTRHASERSWDRSVNFETAKHVANHGTSVPHKTDNGKLITEGRDPSEKNHTIRIVTDNPPVHVFTVIRDTSRPYNPNLSAQQAADEHKEVARAQTSAQRQKLQKQKKQLRSAKASNKNA